MDNNNNGNEDNSCIKENIDESGSLRWLALFFNGIYLSFHSIINEKRRVGRVERGRVGRVGRVVIVGRREGERERRRNGERGTGGERETRKRKWEEKLTK